MNHHQAFNDRDDLNEPLNPGGINNRFQGEMPGEERPAQPTMSSSMAFVLAITNALPVALIACFAISLIGEEGAKLFVGKPKYDDTTSQAKEYAQLPTNYTDPSNPNSGLGMTDAVSINSYVLTTAYSLYQGVMARDPEAVMRILQFVVLVGVGVDVLRRVVRIVTNHGGAINARAPIPETADVVEFVNQPFADAEEEEEEDNDVRANPVVIVNNNNGLSQRLDHFYQDDFANISDFPDTDWHGYGSWKRAWFQQMYYWQYVVPHHVTHDKLFSWVIPARTHNQYFSWMPTLADAVIPVTVMTVTTLVVLLMQQTALDYQTSNNYANDKNNQLSHLQNKTANRSLCYAAPGTNQTGWEQQMECESSAMQYGMLKAVSQEMDSLDSTSQILWYMLAVAVVLSIPVADQVYKYVHRHVPGQPTESVVYSAVMAVTKNLPAVVLLTLGLRDYLTVGFAASEGYNIYDTKKDQLYNFAVRAIDLGGLGQSPSAAAAYAASNARNFYIDYTYGAPLTYSIRWTTALLSVGALDIIIRSYCLRQLRQDGVIDPSKPMSKQQQLEWQVRHRVEIEAARAEGYQLPVFLFDAYLNEAISNSELRNTDGHKFYATIYNFLQNTGLAKLYDPLKIGVLAALTAVVATYVYTNWDVQGLYLDNYDIKYNAEKQGGICISENQIMDCKSKADQYGAIYALEDFMNKLVGYYVEVLYWGPVAAAGASVLIVMTPDIVRFVINQIKACSTKIAALIENAERNGQGFVPLDDQDRDDDEENQQNTMNDDVVEERPSSSRTTNPILHLGARGFFSPAAHEEEKKGDDLEAGNRSPSPAGSQGGDN